MSEFKKGDIIVNQTAVNSGLVELLYEHKHYFHGFSKDFGIITIAKEKLDRYRKATEAEKQIGHRIDNDMGDDSHIENHISPNCKVEELEKQLSEYIFVAETIDEMYVKEVQKSDELQKRVDKAIRLLVEAELYQSEPNIDLAVKALNGEGSD